MVVSVMVVVHGPCQHLQDAALLGHVDALAGSVAVDAVRKRPRIDWMQPLDGVIEPVFLEGFQVLELHAADLAAERFLARKASRVILLLVLGEGRQILVALAALLALERLFTRSERVTDAHV